jgi:zinc protease
MKSKAILITLLTFSILGCQPNQDEISKNEFSVPFEKFSLDNGLEIIFHIDRSDPVVAVALTAHVGSAREKAGRTGFAHLFEHLLFLESENLGKGGLDKMSARIGGSGANGSTSRDRTNYFQTVPKDALEKMIWAEADKLGWFINTVTEPVLAKEKQVVKNEKRQGVDNQPYGHNWYVIDKNLYPEDHPYNWQVIGSLEDLQNATLEDVKEFFKRWYVPNNVTLTISGDFDTEQARAWVHKYFDEIPRGEEVKPLEKRPGQVSETIKLYHEDNFARLPQLTMVWPAVEQYHPDAYALDVLTDYLAYGKKAPLNKAIVERDKLAANVSMFNYSSELAGQLILTVRAFEDIHLDSVLNSIEGALDDFEKEGISEKDLSRIKAVQETDFYNGLSSVLGKGFQLAQYNIFADDPGFVSKDIENILAVSQEDIMNVYQKYFKDKDFIATSFVPKGRLSQVLTGSVVADVVEEPIIQGAEEDFDPYSKAAYEKNPSTFDRSIEPPYGPTPTVAVPEVWQEQLNSGMRIFGIENSEVPLVNFNIKVEGGLLLESLDKTGVANLLAQLLTKGTAIKTPAELEDAIQQLGASLYINARRGSIQVSGNTLARNYQQTMDLVREMILEPRWDEEEFALLKTETISRLQQQMASPNSVAQNAYRILLFGEDDIRSANVLGTVESVNAISLDDLKDYYEVNFSQSVATMHIVGDVSREEVLSSMEGLTSNWSANLVVLPDLPQPERTANAKVYFYDVPGAKQSVLRIGYSALPVVHPDFYPATVANYILGGGGFASQLTQVLRETKGYTYGIRSSFSGSKNEGDFTIGSGVRSNITLEATREVKSILKNYGENYSEADLETTKSFLIKSNARAFETARAKLGMLENISEYDWSTDYVKEREKIVNEMTVERVRSLADQYLDPDKMIWLVVGDRETQFERMKDLGYGEPVLINDITSPENK